MKKKGFTLVELLAVIAILAILVIIALPNVMNLFNRAKENAFETEIKEVFKTAQQQWIADSMFNTQERVYVRTSGNSCENTLDMTGRSELQYYIKLDKSGNVIYFKATDGSYQYSYSGTGLKIEDISGVVQISKIEDESEIIAISCETPTVNNNITVLYKRAVGDYSNCEILTSNVSCTLGQTVDECLRSHIVYNGHLYMYFRPNGSETSISISKDIPVEPIENGFYHEKELACACFDGETEILVYDKKKKRKLKKKLKDITYDDLIVCWDFDLGKFTYEKPVWIQKPKFGTRRIILTFDDGTKLEVVGNHRIYDCNKNTFVLAYKVELGLVAFNSLGKQVKLINKEIIEERKPGYNVITKEHINMFANGILTSQGSNNLYKFDNMRFVKEVREQFTDEDLNNIPKEYIDGLRLKEWYVYDKGTKEKTLEDLNNYINSLMVTKK